MYLSILILPLLGSFLATNRKAGMVGGPQLSVMCMQLSVILCLQIFYEVGLNGSPVHIILGNWINYGNIQIEWNVLFDSLTVTMYLPIVIISFFIQVYSLEYLGLDPQKNLINKGTKLPNSGDTLKFMVPSQNRKILSGWSNDPCMVTTHKIDENQIGYRGSKSKLSQWLNFVKEQRVYGSWNDNILSFLRCTLMGFERNYLIKNVSKQLYNKTYYLLHCINMNQLMQNTEMNPWALTGFIDAQGCFKINIKKSLTHKLGWCVEPKFNQTLHPVDKGILLQLQKFFNGAGKIYNQKNAITFSKGSKKDLKLLIDHLDKYPLLTQKKADFLQLKETIKIKERHSKLSMENLNKIVNIKASINWGLSNKLKSELKFLKILPVKRPMINSLNIPDPYWITGFVSGNGSFLVKISKTNLNLKERVLLSFRITQHQRDIKLKQALVNYFKVGKISPYSNNKPAVYQDVLNFTELKDVIKPFFDKYPLLGTKQLNYMDWCKILKLKEEGYHLTVEGIDLIKNIKSQINSSRII